MEWNEGARKFERIRPAPPPRILVQLSLMVDAHNKFGVRCQESTKNNVSAVADTGCQTSTAGYEIMELLNIPKNSHITTKHAIIGITDTNLYIIGALLLTIGYKGRTTNQMVYISSNSKGLYLSETAIKELGLIDAEFPKQPTHANAAPQKTSNTDGEDCECIDRQSAPNRPDSIPFAPTKENVDKLKGWLIQRFASSAFNRCSHQELNEMTGTPMDIVFKEDTLPYAIHTPIPIPHHWKDKVKKDIDRDVRLGIIEPVPQGTPTKWCSRMVVAPKKDGTPRRTVDLQQLKKATLRETHYTQTPFEIVSATPKNTYKTVLDA